jgi:NAD(P)-dependent dehydrogenase (short-subunit alcohol dehydrogenase family)
MGFVMDTNLNGVFICTKAVGAHMIKQRKGKVINTSSVAAESGGAYFSSYNTSKAAVSMFTRCVALEWAPFNINVNAIGPGFFHTTMTTKEHETPELKEQMFRPIPLVRPGELREVGLLVLFLASDASDYITGQTIYLDGGLARLFCWKLYIGQYSMLIV